MAGSQSPRRARAGRERRRRRSDDGAAQPVGAVRAAPRPARRPRRHDGLAEGGAGGRRQVRREARVLGTVPLRRARRAGSHRASSATRTTGTRARSTSSRIVYLPIVDSTVRLANLSSGQLDFIERMAPSDVPQLKTDARFKISKITEIGYQGITINVGKSDLAQKNPLGKDPRVREAFELALDRDGIVQVVMDGEASRRQPVGRADQPVTTRRTCRCPKRDVARAKALLKEAGVPNPSFTLMTPTTSDAQKIAQVVQAMVKEAGFDVKIQSTEFATSLDLADKGQYDAYVLALERPRRSRRQHLQLRRVQAAAQLRGLLQARGRRDPRTSRAPRAIRRERASSSSSSRRSRSRTGRSSTSITATGSGRTPRSFPGLRTVPDGLVRVQGLQVQLRTDRHAESARVPTLLAYLVRRVATIVPTLVFVSMLIFGLQQLLPGDPAVVLAGEDRDPNVVAYLRAEAAPRRAAAGPLPVLDQRRAARRPRRVAAHAEAGADADPREAAGDARARVLSRSSSRSRSASRPASSPPSTQRHRGTTRANVVALGACRRRTSGSASC